MEELAVDVDGGVLAALVIVVLFTVEVVVGRSWLAVGSAGALDEGGAEVLASAGGTAAAFGK